MNNDLISREALKKSMRKSINERYISWTKTITVADIATLIFDEIEYAPTIDIPNYGGQVPDPLVGWRYVERPKGEWIITGEEQGALGINYKIRKCDKCGWEHSLVIPDNYCPNCGAYMRGGKQ